MRIWKQEGFDTWVVKHHLSMNNIFGKDVLLRTNYQRLWYFDYDILTFDLERDIVILVEKTTDKVLSYSISTGKGSQILNIPKVHSPTSKSILCAILLQVLDFSPSRGSRLILASLVENRALVLARSEQ